MLREPDPEVVADIRFRDESTRDRTRSRGEGVYDWTPEKSVGVWACRNPRCRGYAQVFQPNIDAADAFDRQLAQRSEVPLDRTKILYCDACLSEYKRTSPDRRRGQVERMAVAIRQLKESDDPERERDLVANLEAWGHPDVPGLVSALRERKNAERGSNRRRSL